MRILYCLLLSLGWLRAAAQTLLPALASPPAPDQTLEFIPNQGQWPGAVRYAAAVPGGHLCLEPGGLRYVLLQAIAHPHEGAALPAASSAVQGHQLRVQFVGADAATPLEPTAPTGEVRNYLHGNDPAHWARAVPGYRQVRYQAPWPGIGARFYENETHGLEYDFEVAAGADAGQVQLRYEGATSLRLSDDGQLHVGTSVGEITELLPHAYQLDPRSGERQPVACRYQLQAAEGRVAFALGRYDHRRPLVIDPTVVFSTYTGAHGSNWGFTATYDAAGNMYSGGIVLDDMTAAVSYPTSPGAFQTTFGGVIDIALIKYNTAVSGAAARVWATYLGGNAADFPSSLVVNSLGELVVLGSTSSSNYPTSRGAVQRSFQGGQLADPFGDGGFYAVPNGTDIVVTRLTADGSSLVASTYLGGSGNDGLVPYDPVSSTRQLPQNYGDALRGDVLIDAQNNVYLASTTNSANFPGTAGSFGPAYKGGTCDAVVVKLPADMTSVTWAGYLGGNAADGAYSIQLDASANVYVAGGTLSPNFPATAGALTTTAQGSVDGFVARIAANGSAIQKATYLGTSAYDQAFFVQIGADNGVYLLGQSLGAWPVSAGLYSNPGSHQFIQKLSADLNQSLLSTVFGSGRSTIDISPTAFLVDQCDRVYACGWGGMVNQNIYGLNQPNQNGYTHGLAVTPNAVRTTPDNASAGSDFYLAQFSPGLTSLTYGTYYGDATAGSTGDHVDGGTSRFDPRGVVYAAVCSCFNYSGFPVPPGANTYSPNNGGIGINGYGLPCNNAAFKLNFEPQAVTVDQNQTVCTNAGPITLHGSPSGGVWTGPGVSGSVATGYVFTPSVALLGAQTLTYTLAGATLVCTITGQEVITVVPVLVAALAPLPQSVYCLQAGTTPPVVTLQGSPAGGTYSGPGVVGNTFAPAVAGTGVHTLTYTVGAGTPCPSTTSLQVTVLKATATNFSACAGGGPIALTSGSPTGGTWTGPGVSGSVATGFFFTPTVGNGSQQTLTYSVASAAGSCTTTATATVTVDAPPVASVAALPPVCAGSGPVALAGSPAGGTWTGPGVSGSVATGFVFTPSAALMGTQTLTYTVQGAGSCASVRSQATTTVQVLFALTAAMPADTVLCPGAVQAFQLRATPTGGVWSGPGVSPTGVFTPALGTAVVTYTVGQSTACPVSATRRITLLAVPTLAPAAVPGACVPNAVAPLLVHYSQPAATLPTDAVLTWTFGDNSPATTGFDVTHTYIQAGTFRPHVVVSFNQGRCQQALDLPPVTVQAMFIPNIFTPNGDGQNETFAPRIGGCAPHLQVFSRWGQRVYEDNAYRNTWTAPGLAPGLYYYLLTPTDGLPVQKGWVEVAR
ncbi:MAG: gliding motility-associated C-terminal domain-containing protein [Janthinobacterium lividum]